MEDDVYSCAEMPQIFANEYDKRIIDMVFSPWGGIFGDLAKLGKVAFCNMASCDFDLISAKSTKTQDEVLPELIRRFLFDLHFRNTCRRSMVFRIMKRR